MHDEEKRFWQGIGVVVLMYVVTFMAAWLIWG